MIYWCTFVTPKIKNQHIVKCVHHHDARKLAKFDARGGNVDAYGIFLSRSFCAL